jgi:flagellar operon protein
MKNAGVSSQLSGPVSSGTIQDRTTNASGFAQALQNATGEQPVLRFSSHAQGRLIARNIQLSPEDLSEMDEAIGKAVAKGAQESLLLVMAKQAFIVNIPSRTIITAMDTEKMKDKVFIHVDSVVMV